MEKINFPQWSKLESLRDNPVILYSSMIDDNSVRILYECLRKLGRVERLDLVLSTTGGLVTSTRQLAMLLREYTQYLTILVPYRARSSGTLLCLSANEIVLGPMAELGPIDAHFNAVGLRPSDAPGLISAEDIRMFRLMAEDWFGVERSEDRLQVLALIAQRIFPTTLSSFYRSDRLIRQIAHELLLYQLPDALVNTRQQIVDQLVSGYYTHDYILSREEAQKLGLQVRFTSIQEEALLWDLLQMCRAQLNEVKQAEKEVIGVIASSNFYSHQIRSWSDAPAHLQNGVSQEPTQLIEKRSHVYWEIDI